jgi:hypothetical protein
VRDGRVRPQPRDRSPRPETRERGGGRVRRSAGHGLGLGARTAERGTGNQTTDSAAARSPRLRETAAGSVKGTAAFMAPEQARGEPIGARSDVFALGGVLAALLTGRVACANERPSVLLAMALAQFRHGVTNEPLLARAWRTRATSSWRSPTGDFCCSVGAARGRWVRSRARTARPERRPARETFAAPAAAAARAVAERSVQCVGQGRAALITDERGEIRFGKGHAGNLRRPGRGSGLLSVCLRATGNAERVRRVSRKAARTVGRVWWRFGRPRRASAPEILSRGASRNRRAKLSGSHRSFLCVRRKPTSACVRSRGPARALRERTVARALSRGAAARYTHSLPLGVRP